MSTIPSSIHNKQRPSRKLPGCLIGLVLICMLIPVLTGFSYVSDAFVGAPWAYGMLGRPTLTGKWEGSFISPSGVHFALLMNLERELLANGRAQSQSYNGALISGWASWCDNQGRHADHVRIGGAVPVFSGYNGRADQIEIDLDSASHPQPGLLPDTLSGSWDQDTLTLEPTFSYWDGKTFLYSSNNPDFNRKIRITLTRADERVYQLACAMLAPNQ